MNALSGELSPYLLAHADDPVDWLPWCDQAFDRAREEGKPVFLSIGYSTCHWCHVMQRESFRDPEVAALLNSRFVPVKVDREERPDVDAFYMAACMALSRRGGWPLTVLATPRRRPWFAATYLPPRGRAPEVGLVEALPALADSYETRREEAEGLADELTAALEAENAPPAPAPLPGPGTLERAYRQLVSRFDPEWGGFSPAPKFPQPSLLLFLFRHGRRTRERKATEMAAHTLSSLLRGGIRDHLGQGYHRYSVDARWHWPHFEKMLPDQALLMLAFAEGFAATGKEEFRDAATDIAAYLERDLSSPEGAFLTGEDADSVSADGTLEEGAFYLWSREEVRLLLDPEEDRAAEAAWGLTAGERCVLATHRPLAETAAALGMPPDRLSRVLASAREKLFAARARRPRPFRDDKVLADWNGLAIAALARSGILLHQRPLVERAEAAAGFARRHLLGEEGTVLHRFRAGRAGIPGFLDDHAHLAWGFLELFTATRAERHLSTCRALAERLRLSFRDPEGGGFFLASADHPPLPARMKPLQDGALPCGNSVAAHVFDRLGRLTGSREYAAILPEVGRVLAPSLAALPVAAAFFLTALEESLLPSPEPEP